MRPRIKIKGERVETTRTSTTIEATTYYRKEEHLQKVLNEKRATMGIYTIFRS